MSSIPSTTFSSALRNGVSKYLCRPTLLGRYANPDPQKLLRAQRTDDRLHPVVPRRTAALANPQACPAENPTRPGSRSGPTPGFASYSAAAPRTESPLKFMNVSGLASSTCSGQSSPAPSTPCPAGSDFHSTIFRRCDQSPETQVMRRELILDSGIPKTDDQFHAAIIALWDS